MQFKVGDRVRILSASADSDKIGQIREIVKIIGSDVYLEGCISPWGMKENKLELINSTNINMKEKFATLFKSEPEKSFRKAGITNGDDLLTEEGQQIFLSWMLKKHGEDFKKEVVDKLLEEEKKS